MAFIVRSVITHCQISGKPVHLISIYYKLNIEIETDGLNVKETTVSTGAAESFLINCLIHAFRFSILPFCLFLLPISN